MRLHRGQTLTVFAFSLLKSLTIPEGGQLTPQDPSFPVFGTLCPLLRGASIDECDCDNLDFVAAKALNKEGLSRFVQDRNVIGSLNDRLVRVIELVRTNCSRHIST